MPVATVFLREPEAAVAGAAGDWWCGKCAVELLKNPASEAAAVMRIAPRI